MPPVSDERGNLLASIRAGKQLKKVSNDESARGPSPPADVGLDGMAGALARALQQRNNVLQQSGKCVALLDCSLVMHLLVADSEDEEEQWADEEEDEWGSD